MGRATGTTLRYVYYLSSKFHNIKTKQKITFTFVKALYLEDEIGVEYWRNSEKRTCSWTEYEGIGEAATAAVVAAQWSCQDLQILARMVQQGTINCVNAKKRLDQLSSQAYERRFRLSLPFEEGSYMWGLLIALMQEPRCHGKVGQAPVVC